MGGTVAPRSEKHFGWRSIHTNFILPVFIENVIVVDVKLVNMCPN